MRRKAKGYILVSRASRQGNVYMTRTHYRQGKIEGGLTEPFIDGVITVEPENNTANLTQTQKFLRRYFHGSREEYENWSKNEYGLGR